MTLVSNDRRAGTLVPLFSMPSARSWGIGEIGDLERMTAWLASAGQRLLQLLPITETSPDDPSPYGALSAMAIDPQYISLADVDDFSAIGGEAHLEGPLQAALDRVRSMPAIDYRTVRTLKHVSLRRAFDHFLKTEWAGDSARATAGGWMTTRSFARCMRATRSAPGPTGRNSYAGASHSRSNMSGAPFTTKFCSARTCNGLLMISGAPRAGEPTGSRSLATCHSW
jgi:hypothetical protein